MKTVVDNFLNPEILAQVWPILLRGLWVTLQLCAVVIPLGLAGGLALALVSTARRRWVRWAGVVYTDFFRAFPPLVLLLFVAFGLPFVGIDAGAVGSVAIAFLLNTSSYYGEVIRAGIESVPAGQAEAARSTGLTEAQAMRAVVLPQAVRNVLPDLVGNTLEVIKLTSLASVVAMPELLYTARQAQSITYNATPVIAAGLLYLALLWPAVRWLSRLEHRHAKVH
ncbi:MAG: amino acid ABC transporter permease [Lautropia sp.]